VQRRSEQEQGAGADEQQAAPVVDLEPKPGLALSVPLRGSVVNECPPKMSAATPYASSPIPIRPTGPFASERPFLFCLDLAIVCCLPG
jgi:hypothetical protein